MLSFEVNKDVYIASVDIRNSAFEPSPIRSFDPLPPAAFPWPAATSRSSTSECRKSRVRISLTKQRRDNKQMSTARTGFVR